ncbi:hypothetical protein HDC36_004426 [Xanthomonas sp. JAI131]|uniref:DUF3592 domain-containing protein n=1 Tax=Xanthomonas sp. JAI131 TaxID=2723067 RepID=UPI0015CD2BCE|nr:DUF3592 domain-containing protein [Xanthomonas sp. JAI131]NYF22936.1 hypothetical protein [Xanthomonas sp. JAI131]
MSNHSSPHIGKMLLGLLFALIGIGLLGIAVNLALNRHAFLARARIADGVVSRLNAGGSHPEIAFTTGAGEKISYPQGGLISGYRQDQRVRVRYLPERPAGSAIVDDPGALWGVPGFLGGLGLIFGGVGLAKAVRWRSSDTDRSQQGR